MRRLLPLVLATLWPLTGLAQALGTASTDACVFDTERPSAFIESTRAGAVLTTQVDIGFSCPAGTAYRLAPVSAVQTFTLGAETIAVRAYLNSAMTQPLTDASALTGTTGTSKVHYTVYLKLEGQSLDYGQGKTILATGAFAQNYQFNFMVTAN